MKNFYLLVDKKNPSMGRWIFFIYFDRRIKSRPPDSTLTPPTKAKPTCVQCTSVRCFFWTGWSQTTKRERAGQNMILPDLSFFIGSLGNSCPCNFKRIKYSIFNAHC